MSAGSACAHSLRMHNTRRHPHRLAQATIASTITKVVVWHSPAPGSEVWNTPQTVQLLGLVAPVLLEKRPASQAVQLLGLVAPVLLEKRPAGQAVQLGGPSSCARAAGE